MARAYLTWRHVLFMTLNGALMAPEDAMYKRDISYSKLSLIVVIKLAWLHYVHARNDMTKLLWVIIWCN